MNILEIPAMFNVKNQDWSGKIAQLVECLSHMQKALGSIASTAENKLNEQTNK